MSEITGAQLDEWQKAVGREMVEEQIIDPLSLLRYARAIGLARADADVPLAHWAFFLPCPTDDKIGPDGHPKRGNFLPAITLPRRMFATASMDFGGPVKLGVPGKLTSQVAEVTHKSGRSGDLIFVDVDRTLQQSGSVRVRERQTYVYRDWGDPVPMPHSAPSEPQGEKWEPDEVNLFRFSAATFNGHRIHYDLPYTTGVEGYPALIVHGPFTAARLAGLAMRGGTLSAFSFRALAPLFLGQPIYLRQTSDTACEAVRADGVTAMTAEFKYR
ncbi:hypothetical protein [Erythrobacter sp. SD-21]|uniref:hypothetical protein n=1 Tax=Erythrobacter sp. SD-21 TaxID=161528 RepID=UPI000153F64F|nr:hypothetical protein [Erythrobacter sp. SD-21]EDL50219.1 hypothetical protein ED21_27148 [Erythrobacter sp. SD-21]